MIALVIITLASPVKAASVASLYFSPSSNSYYLGESFSVSVYVSSATQAMNAASGTIIFPTDKLQVSSISKSGSIFTLWVEDPIYSNTSGAISFEGIVLNPGYVGSGGKILTINFLAKAAGTAALSFSSASVLANDGLGSEIFSGAGSASFSISTVATTPEAEVNEPTTEGEGKNEILAPAGQYQVPAAPIVSSSTHPDQNNWYSFNDVKLEWSLPTDVIAVNILTNQLPFSDPGTVSDGLFSSQSYEDVKDGTNYFHIRFKNKNGWGPPTHFKFQIDTVNPNPFEVTVLEDGDNTDPTPTLTFNATDDLSGIDFYKIKVSSADYIFVDVEELVDGTYTMPVQPPGENIILVQAVDRAGNYASAVTNLYVLPLETPVLNEYPTELRAGETFIVRGVSEYPGAEAKIWFKTEDGTVSSEMVLCDSYGRFTFVGTKKLDSGLYEFWATVVTADGSSSLPTERIGLNVKPFWLLKITDNIMDFTSVLTPLMAVILLLAFLLWHIASRFRSVRQSLLSGTQHTSKDIHSAFSLLRNDLVEHFSDRDEEELKKCYSHMEKIEEILQRDVKKIGAEGEPVKKPIEPNHPSL